MKILIIVTILGALLVGCGGSDSSEPADPAAAGDIDAAKAAATARAEGAEKAIEGEVPGDHWSFGAPVSLTDRTDIAALNADRAGHGGKEIAVEGKVTAVCKSSGCWVEVTAEDGSIVRARSTDHLVVVPRNCEGQTIVVQGTFPEGADANTMMEMEAVEIRRVEG